MNCGAYSERSGTTKTPQRSATGFRNRVPIFWRFQIAGWLAFAIFSVPLDHVVLPDIPGSILATIGRDVLGFCLTIGMRVIYQKVYDRKLNPVSIAAATGITSILGGAILTLASIGLHAVNGQEALNSFTPSVTFAVFYFRTAVCAGWSMLYFAIKMMRDEMNRQLNDAKREAEKQHLEIQMLRAQMNPHFLFNALNTISASVAKSDQFSRNLITALSDYLRYSLKNRNSDLVPLSEELEALDSYISVERARFRDELEYTSNIEPAVRAKLVPGVLIQPLIENAIKHGKKTSPRPLKVRLAITRPSLKRLRIEVCNTGHWLNESSNIASASGVGLENIRKRVQLLYPNDHTLQILEHDGWISVSLELPIP
jgi:two-component system LytT family sensor kinase